jgi:dynein heavy chain
VTWQEFKGFMCFNSTANYPTSVKMMSDTQFLQKLMQFPKERINDETCELLQPYFSVPDFNPEDASKASNAAVGLCNWAQAMVTYHEVAKVVDPKIMSLRAAEAELAAANKEKQTAEDALAVAQ